MKVKRFSKSVRRSSHSHDWVVDWLVSHGWKVFAVSVPDRVSVLGGSTDPGWTTLTRETVIEDVRIIGYVRVPGARHPENRLSIDEWKKVDADIVSEHNRLGLKNIPYRKRRCSDTDLRSGQ